MSDQYSYTTYASPNAGIVEVREMQRTWKVNAYLAHGYRLLTVMHVARSRQRQDGVYFVEKSLLYVVGRPTDVEPFDADEAEAGG